MTFPCEPACGSDTYCATPAVGTPMAEWTAFWQRHPSRAGIKTLRKEASLRGGGIDPRDGEHEQWRSTS